MISYFSRQYQAIPALTSVYQQFGGAIVSTRVSTLRATKHVYPETNCVRYNELLGKYSQGYRVLNQAKVIVTGSPNKSILNQFSAQKCMVFHGTYAFMAQAEIDGLHHFDALATIGPRMQEALQNTTLADKLVQVGYLPFQAFPEKNTASRAQFLQSLQLNPDLKTIVYMPRGKPYGSWRVMAEKLLQLPQQYNLILRPHPSQSVTARPADIAHFIKLQWLAKKRPNTFLDLTKCELAQVLAVGDLLISDGASSPEESLYYDMPQLFVHSEGSSPDALARMMRSKKLSETYIERMLGIYDCGYSINVEAENVAEIVEKSLQDESQFAPARAAFFAWVFGDRTLFSQQFQTLSSWLRLNN